MKNGEEVQDIESKRGQGRLVRSAARAASHLVEGETRERLAPVREALEESSATVQSLGGKKIVQLAGKIRDIGRQLKRSDEIDLLARKLEETADYLRFRPADHIVDDARVAIRRHPAIPISAAVLGGVLTYLLVSRLSGR